MLANEVAVNVMGIRTGHQLFVHVVNGNHVLMFCGVHMAFIGDVDESGASTSKANCSPVRVLVLSRQIHGLRAVSYSWFLGIAPGHGEIPLQIVGASVLVIGVFTWIFRHESGLLITHPVINQKKR